jgi:predicted pyridoxine 5'-phosphate oxidase superfamily flavin-nucleotide-binding protein
VAHLWGEGLDITADQFFPNCTKYIQRRVPTVSDTNPVSRRSSRSGDLNQDQQNWINQADTFFLATYHPEGGADASHRGGMPGFITAVNSRELEWPDYSGNNMFLSLGNLAINPKAGLLFVDFEGGRTLQLTGRAEVIWEKERVQRFPGAKRVLRFQVDEVIATDGAFVQRWRLIEYSPANPKVAGK